MNKEIVKQLYDVLKELHDKYTYKKEDYARIIDRQKLKLQSEMDKIMYQSVDLLFEYEDVTNFLFDDKIRNKNRLESPHLFANEMEKVLNKLEGYLA